MLAKELATMIEDNKTTIPPIHKLVMQVVLCEINNEVSQKRRLLAVLTWLIERRDRMKGAEDAK